jgi:hypothetical protein
LDGGERGVATGRGRAALVAVGAEVHPLDSRIRSGWRDAGRAGAAAPRAAAAGAAGAYAVATTGFELLACHVDRALGGHTWDYGSGLCVNAKHTAAWTAAALVVEPFLR